MKTQTAMKVKTEDKDADLEGGIEKLSPEVKTLIEEAKKKGSVTYDELNKVLPDDSVSPEKLDSIFQMLDEMGIEIIEEGADAEKGLRRGGARRVRGEALDNELRRGLPRRSTTRSGCTSRRWARSRSSPARTSSAWPRRSRSRASGSGRRSSSRPSP
jgi:hypothetical protein